MKIRLFIVVIVYRYRLIVVHLHHQLKEKHRISLRLCSWSLIVLSLFAHAVMYIYMFNACFWLSFDVVICNKGVERKCSLFPHIWKKNVPTVRFACLHEIICFVLLWKVLFIFHSICFFLIIQGDESWTGIGITNGASCSSKNES